MLVEVRGMTRLFAEALGLTGATYTGDGYEAEPIGPLGRLLVDTAECIHDACLRVEIDAILHPGKPLLGEQVTGPKSERLLGLWRELAKRGFQRLEVHAMSRANGSVGYAMIDGCVYCIPYGGANSAESSDMEHVVFHDPHWDDDGMD